jgi:hypothetical protein
MNPDLFIAMGGNSVWNANVFFFAWLGLYSCFYLVGDLITVSDPSGLVESAACLPRGLSYFDCTARTWYMLLGSTVALVGVLFDFSNAVCTPPLNTSPMCQRALGAGLLSVFSLLFTLAALSVYNVALLGAMKKARIHAFNGVFRAYKLSQRIGTVLALLVFVVHSTIAGLVSSPTGPGLETGSIFLTAWMSFALSLYLFKKYTESFCIPFLPPLPKKALQMHHIPIAPKPALMFDASFRTTVTNVTDPLDESYKVTDDERQDQKQQQYMCIVEQKLDSNSGLRQDIVQRVPSQKSFPSVPSQRSQLLNQAKHQGEDDEESFCGQPAFAQEAFVNSSNDDSKRSQEPTGSNVAPEAEAGEPMVFTRKQSEVSTLGVGSFITKEPVGFKSGNSYYGGLAADGGPALPPSLRKEPSFEDGEDPSVLDSVEGGSDILYRRTVPTKSVDGDKLKKEGNKQNYGFVRRASYSSTPSLPAVQEASLESSSRATSSRTNTTSAESFTPKERRKQHNRKSITSKKSKSSSKASKSSAKHYKHKYTKKGSEGSSSMSDPKTIAEDEFKLRQVLNDGASRGTANASDFSIVCDGDSIVTEITTEGFDEGYRVPTTGPRQPPRLPTKNPLYNGSNASTASSQPTPRMHAFNSSVDDLVASALQYARKSRQPNNAYNSSARTLTTLSPGGPSIASVDHSLQSGYQNHRQNREMKSHKVKTKGARSDRKMRSSAQSKSSSTGKPNRRASLQSLYSDAFSGEDVAGVGVDFTC